MYLNYNEIDGSHISDRESGGIILFDFLWKGKNVFKSFLMSYLILIMVFLMIIIGITMPLQSIIRNEITQTNSVVFNLSGSKIEGFIDDINQMSYWVANVPEIEPVVKNTDLNDNNLYWNIRNMTKKINESLASSEYDFDLSLYLNQHEIFVIDGGMLNAREIYTSYSAKENSSSYEAWKSFCDSKHYQEMYATDNGDVLYVHSIILNGACYGTIYIRIPQNVIYNIVKLDDKYDGNILLLNHLDELVYAIHYDEITQTFDEKLIDLNENVSITEIANKKVMLYISPGMPKIKYAYLVPQDKLYGVWSNILFYTAILFLLSLIVGVTIAFYYSKRNYKPIKKILAQVQDIDLSDIQKKTDEFMIIEKSLSIILSDMEKFKQNNLKYERSMFGSAMSGFVKKESNFESIHKLLESYEFKFTYKNYIGILVLISDVDYDELYKNLDDRSDILESVVELLVRSVYENALGEEYKAITFRLNDDMLFCIVGTDEESSEKIEEHVKKSFIESRGITYNNTGIEYSVYIGRSFNDLTNIQNVYEQIITGYMFGQNEEIQVVFIDEIPHSSQTLQYDSYLKEQLLTYIENGEADKAKTLINHMFACCVKSVADYVITKLDILSVFVPVITNADISTKEKCVALVAKINACENEKKCKEYFERLLDELLSHKDIQIESDNSDKIVREMIAYISQNYENVDMNINMLGFKFSLSPRYLSHLFKVKTGMLLRDYINKVRLGNAELLLVSDMTVEEIAKQCGFLDSGTFIRSFKRVNGITPGQYRLDKKSDSQ